MDKLLNNWTCGERDISDAKSHNPSSRRSLFSFIGVAETKEKKYRIFIQLDQLLT